MPRLLPRLIKTLSGQPSNQPWLPFSLTSRNRTKSIFKQIAPHPSYHPSHYPRSILLTPANPVTNSRLYARHKSLPPRVHINTRLKKRPGDHDSPRCMSDEERRWWASPYLRMLASPMRKCIVTNRYFPTDFLIRLVAMRLPASNSKNASKLQIQSTARTTLIPDGLQHPKFTARQSGRASYLVCSREGIHQMVERGKHKRVFASASVHHLLPDQIAHLLRLRILQELDLLADHLELQPKMHHAPTILRRLTREEWTSIKVMGIVPYENAIAVLVVPRPNRSILTEERPEGSMSTLPPQIDEEIKISSRPLPPLSTLNHLLRNDIIGENDALPQAQVPLYNGLTLFPAISQRAAAYTLLCRLLTVERRARYRDGASEPEMKSNEDKWARGDKKASHAFLLCSDGSTAARADVAAVAIALWRLRMFEGKVADVE